MLLIFIPNVDLNFKIFIFPKAENMIYNPHGF